MSQYFGTRRRRIGVLTLLVACLSAGGWVRSVAVGDIFEFSTTRGGIHHQFASECSAIKWRYSTFRGYIPPRWEVWRVGDAPFGNVIDRDSSNMIIHYGEPGYLGSLTCPYWMIVIPMTVISAILLLSEGARQITVNAPSGSTL